MTRLARWRCLAVVAAAGLLAAGCSTASTSAPAGPVHGPSPALSARVATFVAGLNAGETVALCALVEPTQRAICHQGFVAAAAEGVSVQPSGLAVGEIRVQGDRAVVSLTGTFCEHAPEAGTSCHHNTDPHVAFVSGQSFADAFSAASGENGNGSVFQVPFVEVNGTWYAAGA